MKRSYMIAVLAVLALLIIATAFYMLFPQKPVEEIKEIKLSAQPSWHHAAIYLIKEKGWDIKILKANITLTTFPSGPPQMEAFGAGQHVIAYVGATPPLPLISKGFDAKIVAVVNTEGSSVISVPEFTYKGPSSFEGKTIMTFPPGSIQYTVLMKWLRENGVDVSKVSVKSGGPAEVLEALRAKAVDLGFVPDPAPYTAVEGGYAKIVIKSGDMMPAHPCCVVVMRGNFIRESRELAVKFLALHVVAEEYIIDPKNKDEVVNVLVKWLGIDRKVAEHFPGSTNFKSDPRDGKWLNGLDMLCEALYNLNITKDEKGSPVRLTTDNVVNPTLYEEALKLVPQIKKELGLP
ncbi:MAG: ABC transporter substrate-binding protein [Candidatus Korarchaeum sp.]|nr:ABC transporter substrate-binding protein [Candidatus Korarchaeum sp.]